MSASWALQVAVVSALKGGSPPATDAGQNVFDTVSSDVYPRITVGDGQLIPVRGSCYESNEIFMDIDIWTTNDGNTNQQGVQLGAGYKPGKNIEEQVRAVLDDAELLLDGYHLELMVLESIRYMRDPDGVTRHVAMTYRAQVQPEA